LGTIELNFEELFKAGNEMETGKKSVWIDLADSCCHAAQSFILLEISERAEEVEAKDEEIHGYHAGGDDGVALRHSRLYILRETWTKHPNGNKCCFIRADS
jgi:hypothetical protein